jgi:hypothetical protein
MKMQPFDVSEINDFTCLTRMNFGRSAFATAAAREHGLENHDYGARVKALPSRSKSR